MLPIANSGGVMLFLDGGHCSEIDRSDFVLGGCVSQTKPPKATTKEGAAAVAVVDANPEASAKGEVKAKGKGTRNKKAEQKNDNVQVVTHTVEFKGKVIQFPTVLNPKLEVTVHMPYLVRNPSLPCLLYTSPSPRDRSLS
eukprot:3217533-Pyramimonas_sp.AAC.1